MTQGRHHCGATTTKGHPCRRMVPDQHEHCPTHTDTLQEPTPTRAEDEARKAEAFRLRRLGLTFQEIADQLGYTDRATARNLVRRYLADLSPDMGEVKDMRALERARLERVLAAVYPAATRTPGVDPETGEPRPGPDLESVDRVIRIVNSLVKLDGLAAPIQVEHSGPGGGPIDFASMSHEQRRDWMVLIAREADRRVQRLEQVQLERVEDGDGDG